MSERTLKRTVKVEFKPERSDPYGLDYKINIQQESMIHSIPLTIQELITIREEIDFLLPP